MSIALPNGQVAQYLNAIGASAVFVTQRLRVDADTMPGLRRRQCSLAWIVWVRSIEEARHVAAIDAPNGSSTSDLQANHATANTPSTGNLPAIVTAIEQRAAEFNVPLTPHDKAIERAKVLAQRVDGTLQMMRTTGALKAFNLSYKIHRHKMNGHAKPYSWALGQLRGEVIRFLVEVPREEMSPAMLTNRLRAKFPWYVYFG